MGMKRLRVDSVAEGFLELLEARGVRYFFGGGAGTDFPPFIEAFAKREAQGRGGGLRPVTVIHEITTISMAHGYTMVTGEPQAAMVHTIAGTANAVGGIINAARARVPMLVAAGRTSITEKGHVTSRGATIHWAQESFDQAGLVREFVKWDYELRRGEQLETVVDRALAIASNAPSGPVYLTLPLDVAGEALPELAYSASARMKPSAAAQPEPTAIERAAQALAEADNPLIVTSSLGRDPGAVETLVALANRLAIPVVESWGAYMNFPHDHPLHQGFEPDALVGEADAVLVIESDTPWFPNRAEPPSHATVIQVDDDPLYERYPIRGHATDIGLAGNAAATLRALGAHVAKALTATVRDVSAIDARRRRWEDAHRRQRQAWNDAARRVSDDRPMDYRWISRCIGDVLDDDDIVVTEISLDPTQTCFRRPGTFFSHPHSGVLGWAPGAALGAKLACPDRTVICAIGDGGHVFGVPTATHFMSRAYDLPVLFVIYNNGSWQRSREATFRYAPDGWAARAESVPLCELEPSPRFDLICEANGGHGALVEDPADLPGALERALHAVRVEKRQALLNVIARKD